MVNLASRLNIERPFGLFGLVGRAGGSLHHRHQVTSSSWDTVTELIALCQNSPPTQALNNTSIGIQRYATYTKRVKIRAMRLENGTDEERLCLLYNDDDLEAHPLDSRKSIPENGTIVTLAKATLCPPLISTSRSTSATSIATTIRAQASSLAGPKYEMVKVNQDYNQRPVCCGIDKHSADM